MIDDRQAKIVNLPGAPCNPTRISTSVFVSAIRQIEEDIVLGLPEVDAYELHRAFNRVAREHGVLLT